MAELKHRLRNPLSALAKGDGGQGHQRQQRGWEEQVALEDEREGMRGSGMAAPLGGESEAAGPNSSRGGEPHASSESAGPGGAHATSAGSDDDGDAERESLLREMEEDGFDFSGLGFEQDDVT